MKLRKIICILLAVWLAVGACVYSASAADEADSYPDLLAGDADRDGDVTIVDATKIQRVVAELDDMDGLTRQVAKNEFSAEELTILDATNIQRWLAELFSASTGEVKKPAFIWRDGEYISVIEDYQKYVDAFMEENDYYGVLYVTRNGRVLCGNAYGKVSREITIDTQFPIGSLSKQFCGTAIALLEERGLLSADDTLEQYFPEYTVGKDITVSDLLHMRSGIIDFINQARPGVAYPVSADNTAQQNKQIILNWLYGKNLRFTPGDHYAYSNTNYFLLAEIVEQVSGMKYSDFVTENIFKPLHMDNTGFYEDLYESENLAEIRVEDFEPEEPTLKGLTQGAGDIVSCAKDMDKWMTSFRTGALLSKESIARVTAAVDNYGYGWGVYGSTLNHNGAIAAYLSADMTCPSEAYNFFTVTTGITPNKMEKDLNALRSSIIAKTSL